MSTTAASKRRAAENLLAEAAEQEALQERFGTDSDYTNNTVITWQRQFARGSGMIYTYVAVKLGGRWFVTGQQGNQCNTLEQLVERHLQYALNDEVFIVTEWTELV